MIFKKTLTASLVLVILAIALWRALFVTREIEPENAGGRAHVERDERSSPAKSPPIVWGDVVKLLLDRASSPPKRSRIESGEARGLTLVVRVIDLPSGKPFADVPVILREQRLDPVSLSQKPGSLPIYEDVRERSGTTDANGSVSFRGVRAAHHRVVLDSGCVFGDDVQVDVVANSDETEQVVILAARPAIELTGLVIDPDAKPLAGVTIHAVAKSVGGAHPTFGTSDKNGRFSLPDLDPGGSVEGARRVLAIRAEHPKFLAPETMIFEAGAGTNEMPTIVMRSPGAAIRGRIIDQDGIPVARTEVYLMRDGREVRGSRETRVIKRHFRTDVVVAATWSTDADGRFFIDGLEPATYELRCEKMCGESTPAIRLLAGTEIDLGDVRFATRKVELRGTAVFEDGSPAVGASFRFGDVSEKTNPAGEFLAKLCDASALDLTFRWHDDITGIDWEQVTRGVAPGSAPLGVVLVPRGLVVRLVDAATGEPVDLAMPQFSLRDSNDQILTESHFGRRPKGKTVPVASIENFRMPTDDLAPGRVALTIRMKGFRQVETSFEIPQGGFTRVETLEVRLEKT